MTFKLSENDTKAYIGGVASFVPTHNNEILQRNRYLSAVSINTPTTRCEVFQAKKGKLLCGLNAISNCFGYELATIDDMNNVVNALLVESK